MPNHWHVPSILDTDDGMREHMKPHLEIVTQGRKLAMCQAASPLHHPHCNQPRNAATSKGIAIIYKGCRQEGFSVGGWMPTHIWWLWLCVCCVRAV